MDGAGKHNRKRGDPSSERQYIPPLICRFYNGCVHIYIYVCVSVDKGHHSLRCSVVKALRCKKLVPKKSPSGSPCGQLTGHLSTPNSFRNSLGEIWDRWVFFEEYHAKHTNLEVI